MLLLVRMETKTFRELDATLHIMFTYCPSTGVFLCKKPLLGTHYLKEYRNQHYFQTLSNGTRYLMSCSWMQLIGLKFVWDSQISSSDILGIYYPKEDRNQHYLQTLSNGTRYLMSCPWMQLIGLKFVWDSQISSTDILRFKHLVSENFDRWQ